MRQMMVGPFYSNAIQRWPVAIPYWAERSTTSTTSSKNWMPSRCASISRERISRGAFYLSRASMEIHGEIGLARRVSSACTSLPASRRKHCARQPIRQGNRDAQYECGCEPLGHAHRINEKGEQQETRKILDDIDDRETKERCEGNGLAEHERGIEQVAQQNAGGE